MRYIAFSVYIELPELKPTITGIHSRYRQGDTLQGNCTSNYSRPAANLTWTINDVPVSTYIYMRLHTYKYKAYPIRAEALY